MKSRPKFIITATSEMFNIKRLVPPSRVEREIRKIKRLQLSTLERVKNNLSVNIEKIYP